MPVTLTRPNGVHILTKATLQQLIDHETVTLFAGGLLLNALAEINPAERTTLTLAAALHDADNLQLNALFTALLLLDAEVNTIVDDETRVFPLPGFLSYRANLPPHKFPLNTLRLPPLNPDGHYLLTMLGAGYYLGVRLDLHPDLKVAGHVRVALARPGHLPQRLNIAEHRLDRQQPEDALIYAAIAAETTEGPSPLTDIEQTRLFDMLKGLVTEA